MNNPCQNCYKCESMPDYEFCMSCTFCIKCNELKDLENICCDSCMNKFCNYCYECEPIINCKYCVLCTFCKICNSAKNVKSEYCFGCTNNMTCTFCKKKDITIKNKKCDTCYKSILKQNEVYAAKQKILNDEYDNIAKKYIDYIKDEKTIESYKYQKLMGFCCTTYNPILAHIIKKEYAIIFDKYKFLHWYGKLGVITQNPFEFDCNIYRLSHGHELKCIYDETSGNPFTNERFNIVFQMMYFFVSNYEKDMIKIFLMAMNRLKNDKCVMIPKMIIKEIIFAASYYISPLEEDHHYFSRKYPKIYDEIMKITNFKLPLKNNYNLNTTSTQLWNKLFIE